MVKANDGPKSRPEGEIRRHWKAFVQSLRTLLGGLPDHRHQDQYVRVKDAALALAESDDVASEVERGYRVAVTGGDNRAPRTAATSAPFTAAVEVVVAELEAFPLAMQVHEADEKAGTAKSTAGKQLRSAAKTVLGSVGDVFKLTDTGKATIAVLKEAVDLFTPAS